MHCLIILESESDEVWPTVKNVFSVLRMVGEVKQFSLLFLGYIKIILQSETQKYFKIPPIFDLEQEKESKSPPKNDGEKPSDQTKPWVNTGSTYKPPRTNNGLMCAQCGTVFTSMVKYDGHRTKGCDNTTQK